MQSALAEVLTDRGCFSEAEATAREALAVLRRAPGGPCAAQAEALANLAYLLRELGRFDEAEARQTEALALQMRLHGAGHPG